MEGSPVATASLPDLTAFSTLLTRYSGRPERLCGGICELQEDQPAGSPVERVQDPNFCVPARFGIERGDAAHRCGALTHNV